MQATCLCLKMALVENIRRSNFCKDHRDKIEVPDPLVVEDLISDNLNNRRKQARLIKQYRDISLYCLISLACFRLFGRKDAIFIIVAL